MSWVDEATGWLLEKFIIDDIGPELDRLSGLLRAGSIDERLAAVKQLTYMEATDSVSLLIGALKDADPQVRRAAAGALGYKGELEAVSPLAVLLADADAGVRVEVVQALDQIGRPPARSWIRTWRERMAARPPDPRIPELLGRALADPQPSVRAAALTALPRHGARGVAIVQQALGSGAAEAKADEVAAAEPALVQALEAKDPSHRRAAVEALFRLCGERAIGPLASALDDEHAGVRQAAVEAVTALSPRLALDELLERLEDPNEHVAVKVIEGLVCARSLEALSPEDEERIHLELVQTIRRRDAVVRARVAWALGVMGRVGAVNALCELLEDPEPAVLTEACEALGRINDPRATSHLLALLERAGPVEVVAAAARSLARAEDVRVVPALVRMLFAEIRPEAEKALEEALAAICRGAEEAARPGLQSDDAATRLQAVRLAVSEPRLFFAVMSQALESADEALRSAALEVLQRQGYDLAELARSALRLQDKAAARRILAINLLASLRAEDAVTCLEPLLVDQNEPLEVHRHCVAALGRLGSEAARTALEFHRSHAQEPIREAVQKALADWPA